MSGSARFIVAVAATQTHHVKRTQIPCDAADATGWRHSDGCRNTSVNAQDHTSVQTEAILYSLLAQQEEMAQVSGKQVMLTERRVCRRECRRWRSDLGIDTAPAASCPTQAGEKKLQ